MDVARKARGELSEREEREEETHDEIPSNAEWLHCGFESKYLVN